MPEPTSSTWAGSLAYLGRHWWFWAGVAAWAAALAAVLWRIVRGARG